MKFEEFEELMLVEWRKNVLSGIDSESPYFDKLYAIKEQLYGFFYPLGIRGNDTHSVSEVWREVNYAMEDDGDLSIVVAYIDISDKARESQIASLKRIRPSFEPKPITDKDLFVKVFIVKGDSFDLTEEYIKPIALKHYYDGKFVKFIAKPFNYRVLDFIYDLKPRFDMATKLANGEKPGFESMLKSLKGGYLAYEKETENMLVDFVVSL